jgi:hypothetical protein
LFDFLSDFILLCLSPAAIGLFEETGTSAAEESKKPKHNFLFLHVCAIPVARAVAGHNSTKDAVSHAPVVA